MLNHSASYDQTAVSIDGRNGMHVPTRTFTSIATDILAAERIVAGC